MVLRTRNDARRARGFSLVELLAAVVILSMLGGLALGSGSAARNDKAAAGAAEIASALRWARQESRRSKDSFGVSVETLSRRVRVFRIPAPPSPQMPVYDVRHPVSKRIWSHSFAARAETAGVTVSSAFAYFGTCMMPMGSIIFSDGEIRACLVPGTIPLDGVTYTTSFRGLTRQVAFDGITGRVVIR